MNGLKVALALTLVLNLACHRDKKDRDDNPALDFNDNTPDSDSQVLSFNDFKYPSFDDISLEQKCEGMRDFFKYLTKKHLLPDVIADIDTSECGIPSNLYNPDSESHAISVTLSRGGQELVILPEVKITYPTDGTLQISKRSEIMLRLSENKKFTVEDVVGKDFAFFDKAFKDWVNSVSAKDENVTSASYKDFLSAVLSRIGNDSAGFKVELDSATLWHREQAKEGPDALNPEQRWLSFHVEPFVEGGTGKLIIVDAGPEVFREIDHQGKAYNCPFFGCNEVTCLREKKFAYKFYGANLYLVGDIGVDGKSESQSRFIYRFSRDHAQNK